MKRTKVICTMGPATDSEAVVRGLIENGMNVARFNFSHGTHDEQYKRLSLVRKVSDELSADIAILLDTKGPEMRLGLFEQPVLLEEGQEFVLTTEQNVMGSKQRACVNYPDLAKEIAVGAEILLSDGLVNLKVTDIKGSEIYTKVMNTGTMSSRKRVAVPGALLNLPFLSEQDVADIKFAIAHDMDYIAASFVQKAQDVLSIRRILEASGSEIGIIAKIENSLGVENIEEIIKVSDGIMVARGDLGVEIPTEEVPLVQKSIIKKCNIAAKPVITATQMLESMVKNPRPTRAEASDVANAILDGSDVIMLSGETASGDYPIEAVKTMSTIAVRTEEALNHQAIIRHVASSVDKSTTNAIGLATTQTALTLGATAILAASESGYTPRMIAKYRPHARVIAVTPNKNVARRMQLYWGVCPIVGRSAEGTDAMISNLMELATTYGYVQEGDLVVVTAGVPVGKAGSTNMLYVHLVAKQEWAGTGIGRKIVKGRVCVVEREQDFANKFQEGDILVVKSLEEGFANYALKASAVITEEAGLTSHAAIVAVSFGIPTIVGVAKATSELQDGMLITVSSERGYIYRGHINAQ